MKHTAKPRCGATSTNFNDGTCNRHKGHQGDHYDSNGNTWPPHFKPKPKTDESKPRCVIATDKVPTDWADGEEGMTVEQWGQKEFESGHKAGAEAGRLEAYNFILAQATTKFQEGNDVEATKLRILAYAIRNLK